jgi:hypothetical protein
MYPSVMSPPPPHVPPDATPDWPPDANALTRELAEAILIARGLLTRPPPDYGGPSGGACPLIQASTARRLKRHWRPMRCPGMSLVARCRSWEFPHSGRGFNHAQHRGGVARGSPVRHVCDGRRICRAGLHCRITREDWRRRNRRHFFGSLGLSCVWRRLFHDDGLGVRARADPASMEPARGPCDRYYDPRRH